MSQIHSRRKHFIKRQIDLAIHQAVAIARKRSLEPSFQTLLAVVVSRSSLLRAGPPSGYAGWPLVQPMLHGLMALSANRRGWLTDAEQWTPPEAGRMEQFGSLARHLLASHPVPNFMTKVWLQAPSDRAGRQQKVFRHLGLGNSIRGASLPIRLTRPMADCFIQAPDHFTLEQALRWSQVRGLGGSQEFASAVLATRLGSVFEQEAYWSRAIEFLIRQPGLDLDMLPPIIEFLHARRLGFLPWPLGPAADQSFGAFLRKVRKWMADSPVYGRRFRVSWPPSGIRGFRTTEPQSHEWAVCCWTIRELLNSRELYEEGSALRHCVAGYADLCAKRSTSIWSMQRHGLLSCRRVLTIEVKPATRTIVTALGWRNSRPKPDTRKVLETWADHAGLKLAIRT